MDWVTRKSCTVCGSSALSFLLRTPKLPVFQGCVTSPEVEDLSFTQEWVSCKDCETIQLASLLPLGLVYGSGHAESFGRLWDSHHLNFSKFILQYTNNAVCEVGGGVGKLAKAFRDIGGGSKWYNLDPNPRCTNSIVEYQAIRGFFDESFVMPNDVNTLVFSHCLEHMYDFLSMVKLLARKLKGSDKLIISWPLIEDWLALGLPGALNWEHTFFLSVETLKNVLGANGFRVINEEIFHQNHSIFLAFEKIVDSEVNKLNANLADMSYLENRSLVSNYFENFEKQVLFLKNQIMELPKPFWLMPASIYSQYLYAFGLRELDFAGVLDNSESKKNRRLYGTPYYVQSPSSVPINQTGTVLLNGGSHTPEIVDSLKNSNPNLTVLIV